MIDQKNTCENLKFSLLNEKTHKMKKIKIKIFFLGNFQYIFFLIPHLMVFKFKFKYYYDFFWIGFKILYACDKHNFIMCPLFF